MEGMISIGNNFTYDDFRKSIPNEVLPLFEKIRNFCLSLSDNVVEDIRMHRIVFCKSITFRWFADVKPQNNQIIIKIQKDRKIPSERYEVNQEEELTEIFEKIKNAFELIH